MLIATVASRLVFTLATLIVSALVLDAQSGMLWDESDLGVWRQRAVSGPYKNAGDAYDPLIPGEWQRIEQNATQFRANPTADRKSSYYVSYSSAGAAEPNYVLNHMTMLDASLYALVKDDQALSERIKDELVWHASQASLQVDRDLFQKTDFGNWWNAAWVYRLVMCADLVRDSFSSAEIATFNAWVADWAYSYEGSIHYELSSGIFGNRYQRDYTNNLKGAAKEADYNTYAYKDGQGVLHNQIASIHRRYNNRKAMVMQFVGFAGVWLDDPVLIDRGKLFFEEWLKYSVFPDGTSGEYERNSTSRSVQQGLNYNCTTIAAGVALADALARRGDRSLIDFETRDGLFGTESGSGEGAKSLRLTVETYLDHIENKLDYYYAKGPVEIEYRLDAISEIGSNAGTQWISEIYFAPIGNRYWKSERIKKGYMRQASGSIPYSNPMGTAGPYQGPWRSQQAVYPSLLFMFAEMENLSLGYPAGSPEGNTDSETGDTPTDPEPPVEEPPVEEPPVEEPPVEDVDPGFDLIYATNYNWSNYLPLDEVVLEAPAYIAVKPSDNILSITFYEKQGELETLVNQENYGPFDYIKQEVPLLPSDIGEDGHTVVAIVTAKDGQVYRLEATVYNDEPGGDVIEEEVPVDDDRLPDDWELQYFGRTDLPLGDEDADFDGDLISNYDEWVAGTDPTDANDSLTLEPVLGVTWKSHQERSYRIEFTDDNWRSSSASAVIDGNGDTIVWVDPTAKDVRHNRQYRIVVVNN